MTSLTAPVTEVARRRARAAVTTTFVAHGLVVGAWAPRIPEIKSHLHLSPGALGLALLAPALGTLLIARVAGHRTALHSSGAVTRVLAIGFGLSSWLPGVAWDLGALFFALLIWGAAMGSLDVAMNSQGVTVEQRYRRPVLSGFHAAWSLGTFTGALLGGIGVAIHLNIAVQQLVLGVAAAGAVSYTGRWFLADDPHELAPRERRLRMPRRPQSRLLLLGVSAICALIAEGAVADWSGVLLRDHLDVTGAAVSAAYACFCVCMTAGRMLGDRTVAAFGRSRALTACGVVGAVGLGAGLAVDSWLPAVAGFGALGLGLSIMVPVLFSTAADTDGPSGPAIATVSALGCAGMLAGPSLIGFLANGTSVRAALMVLPPVTLAAGVLGVAGVRSTAQAVRRGTP